MSKKQFRSQASSGRAFSGAGFGGFGTSTFGSYSSPLSYVYEPPDLSSISDANVGVSFKNLMKKDSTTKGKALEDLQAYVTSADVEIEEGLLAAWVKLYPRLSIDSSRRVRQLAHVVQGSIATKCGKRTVKYMPEMAGPWLAGAQDSDRAAARSAQDALRQTFSTPEKLQNLSKVFQQAILEYCRDAVLNETVQTLSDERTVNSDDAEATYARVVATSIAVLTNLISELPEEELAKQQATYETLLGDEKIWSFASHKDVAVRRGAFRLLRACMDKQKHAVEQNLKHISASFIGKALPADQSGSAAELTQSMIQLTKQFPTVWTSDYSGKRAADQRLRQFVKRGSQGGSTDFWDRIWVLFSQLPIEVLPKSVTEAKELLTAVHDGVSQREERFNASSAYLTYFKIVDLVQQMPGIATDEEHEDLLRAMVLPIITQYLRPSSEDAHWALSGAKAYLNVARASCCRKLPDLFVKVWPDYAANLVEDIKSSQPEQAKDFDKSQTAIASAGERWALLQSELLKTSTPVPEALHRVYEKAAIKIVREALDVLRKRNGKPYGAAAVVNELVSRCKELVTDDQDAHDCITSFLLQEAPEFASSPSQSQLISLLYHLHDDAKFEQIWTVTADSLLNVPDSLEKLTTLRSFLLSPRVQPAAHLAQQHSELQAYLIRHSKTLCESEGDWSIVAGAFKEPTPVASNHTREAILSSLVASLTLSNHPSAVLEGLSQLTRQAGPSTKQEIAKVNGGQLLPRLLLLEDSPDDLLAQKATDLNKRITSADEGHGRAAASDVISRGLAEISPDSLPVLSLLEMAARLSGESNDEAIKSFIPDLTTWEQALSPFLSIAPPISLAVMSALGGTIYLLGRADNTSSKSIPRDADGYSQALRFAMFVAKIFSDVASFEKLAPEMKTDILYFMAITVLLANDNISIAGSNDLWAMYSPEAEEEVLDFIGQGQRMITRCLENQPMDTKAEEASIIDLVLGRCLESSKSMDPSSFYNATVFAQLQSELLEIRGCTAAQAQEYSERIKMYRKNKDTLRLLSCTAAFQQSLWTHHLLDRYCNELVADLTGADVEQGPEDVLTRLVSFNVITRDQDAAVSVIAKQRIVFLVKHVLPWLNLGEVSTAIKSETLRALLILLPGMGDMYGEHWSQVIRSIIISWSSCPITTKTGRINESGLPLIHASLKLNGSLRSIKSSDDPNDDLVDAWKEAEPAAATGLVALLTQSQSVPDDAHQPLKSVNELVAREISRLPTSKIEDAGSIYPLLYTPSQSVQRTAFSLLHKYIPAAQEQISFDSALENKAAQLPEELLSLVLEAPTLDTLASASFARTMPLDLSGYLYSWILIFDHFSSSSYKVKTDYIENIKDGAYLGPLLDLTFDFLGHSRGKPVDVSKLDITKYTPDTVESPERDTQWLLSHLYYLALTNVPSLTKSHYLSLTSRQTSLSVESWTSKYVSPLIINASLSNVAEWASTQVKDDTDFENVSVKVAMRSKEVNVSYLVDEQTMAIVVRLPETYPLQGARVEGISRVAVDEKRWQSWLRNCQGVITFSNGNLIDGLSAWRKNVTGALKGQTECAICYSIISGDKQLPSKRCGTCKNLFHSSCLFKWFKTSNASTCPLCRNAFNYG